MVASAVHGQVDEGWGKVADAFRANFERGLELGSACCVYADGRPVVDIWGGVADPRTDRPWDKDTVVTVFSMSKGAVAICAHLLAERGLLDLGAPVVSYWPEFGAAGKEGIPVRWLLSHQSGLPAVDADLTLDDFLAWDPVVHALECQAPFWPPGTQHIYHANTYGFLVGEVIRRVTGKTVGTFFAEEIAAPLGLDAWIGTPAEVEPRVALLLMDPPAADRGAALASVLERVGADAGAVPRLLEAMAGMADPSSVSLRSHNVGGALPPESITPDSVYNSRAMRAAELPATNMVTNARSLARLYAATVGEVDGTRLLGPETVRTMSAAQTVTSTSHLLPPELEEFLFLFEPPFALGFQLPSLVRPMLGASSFGHAGAGGSLSCADPESGVAFAYVMNRMLTQIAQPRLDALLDAVPQAIAGSG